MEKTANMTELGLLHWRYENPQVESFWFEQVDGNELRIWSKQNLPTCGIICAFYFLFVWLAPIYMKNRPAYKLQKPLAAWNFFLSLFSLAVVIRMTPALVKQLSEPDGFYRSACVNDAWEFRATYWGFLYVLSKFVELGDTVFIVLRKKPLILLHWFHHFNMVWSTSFMFVEGEPCCKWIAIVNSFVHTVMYAYYGLRALGVKLPKRVSMLITSLQITQFVWGLIGQYQQYLFIEKGKPCLRTKNSVILTTIFGFSYLFLFTKLFYNSYLVKPKSKTA